MHNPIRWLRISYWVGAVIDAYVAVELSAQFLRALNSQSAQWSDYQTAAGTAAALMWGWTVLLIWANRKPLERRGILLITVLPVIVGLGVHELAALTRGLLPWSEAMPGLIVRPLLITLFLTSYWQARNVPQSGSPVFDRASVGQGGG